MMLAVFFICSVAQHPTATIGDSSRYILIDYTNDGFASSVEALKIGWQLNINASTENNVLKNEDITVATPSNNLIDFAETVELFSPPKEWSAVDPSTAIPQCFAPSTVCTVGIFETLAACLLTPYNTPTTLCYTENNKEWLGTRNQRECGLESSCEDKMYVYVKNANISVPSTYEDAALQPTLLNSDYAQIIGAPDAARCAANCYTSDVCSAWQFDKHCTIINNTAQTQLTFGQTVDTNFTEMIKRGYDVNRRAPKNKAYADGSAVPPYWTLMPQDINAQEQNIPLAWKTMYSLGINNHFNVYERQFAQKNIFAFFPQPYTFEDLNGDFVLSSCPVLPPRRLLGALYNWMQNSNATSPHALSRTPYNNAVPSVFSSDGLVRCPIYERSGATPTYTKGVGCVAPNGNRTSLQSIVELCNNDHVYMDDNNVVNCRFAQCTMPVVCQQWNAADPYDESTCRNMREQTLQARFQKSTTMGLVDCTATRSYIVEFSTVPKCDQVPFTYTELSKTVVAPWCVKKFQGNDWFSTTRDARRMCFQNLTDVLTILPSKNSDIPNSFADEQIQINALRNTRNPQSVFTHFRNLQRNISAINQVKLNFTKFNSSRAVPKFLYDSKYQFGFPYNNQLGTQFERGLATDYVDAWSFYYPEDFQYWQPNTPNTTTINGPGPSAATDFQLTQVPVVEGAKADQICSFTGNNSLCNWRALKNLPYPTVQGTNTSNIAQSLDMFCALLNYNVMFGAKIKDFTVRDTEDVLMYIPNFANVAPTIITQIPEKLWLNPELYQNFAIPSLAEQDYYPYGSLLNYLSAGLACPAWKIRNWPKLNTSDLGNAFVFPNGVLSSEPDVHVLDRQPKSAIPIVNSSVTLNNPRFSTITNTWFYEDMSWLTATATGFLSQEPAPYFPGSVSPAFTPSTSKSDTPDPGCNKWHPYLLTLDGESFACYDRSDATDPNTPRCFCSCSAGLGQDGSGYCFNNGVSGMCTEATLCDQPVDEQGGVPTNSIIKTGPRRGMATASTPISITPSQAACSQHTNDAACIDSRCVWWQPSQKIMDIDTYCGIAGGGEATKAGAIQCAQELQNKSECPACKNKQPQCVSCSDKLTPQTCDTPQSLTNLSACAWDYVSNLCVHVPLWREARQKGGLFPVNRKGLQVALPFDPYSGNDTYYGDKMVLAKYLWYQDPDDARTRLPPNFGPGMRTVGNQYFNPASNTRFTNSESYSPYILANQTMPFLALNPSLTPPKTLELLSEYDASACASGDCGEYNFNFVHKLFTPSTTIDEFLQHGGNLNEIIIYSGCSTGLLALFPNDLTRYNAVFSPSSLQKTNTLNDFWDAFVNWTANAENLQSVCNYCGWIWPYDPLSLYQVFVPGMPNETFVQPNLKNNARQPFNPFRGLSCIPYISNLRGFSRAVLSVSDTVDTFSNVHKGTLADIYIDTGCSYGPVAAYTNDAFEFTSSTLLETVFEDAYKLCLDASRRTQCCGSLACQPTCVRMKEVVPYAHPVLYGGKATIDTTTHQICETGDLTWFAEGATCVSSTTPASTSNSVYKRQGSQAASNFNPTTWKSRDGLQVLRAFDAPAPSDIIGVPGPNSNTLTFVQGTAIESFEAGFAPPNVSTFMPLEKELRFLQTLQSNMLNLNQCWRLCSADVACVFCWQTGNFWSYGYENNSVANPVFDKYVLEPFPIYDLKLSNSKYAKISAEKLGWPRAYFNTSVNTTDIDECNRITKYRLFGFENNTCYINPVANPFEAQYQNITAFRQYESTAEKTTCDLDVTPRCNDSNPVVFDDVYNTSEPQPGYFLLNGRNDFFLAGVQYVPLFEQTLPASPFDNVTLFFEDFQMCGYVNDGVWNKLPTPCAFCSKTTCQSLPAKAYDYYLSNLNVKNVTALPAIIFEAQAASERVECANYCVGQPYVVKLKAANNNQTYCFPDIDTYQTFTKVCLTGSDKTNFIAEYTQPLQDVKNFRTYFESYSTEDPQTVISVENLFGNYTYTYKNFGYSNGMACKCSSACADSVGAQFMATLPLLKQNATLPECNLDNQAGFVSETNFTVAGLKPVNSETVSSMQECIKTCQSSLFDADAVRFSVSKTCICYQDSSGKVDYYAMTDKPNCTLNNCDRRAGCTLEKSKCVRTKTSGDLEMPLPINSVYQAQVIAKSNLSNETSVFWQMNATMTDINLHTYSVGTVPKSLLTQSYQAANALTLKYPVPILSAGAAPTPFIS